MPLVFQGPLGYTGERGFRGEPVSHLHPEDYGVNESVGKTSTHVIAGYITVNYTNQQHCTPLTSDNTVRENQLLAAPLSLMFCCYNFFTGSTGTKGRARREGLAGKKVVVGSSHRAWTGEFLF